MAERSSLVVTLSPMPTLKVLSKPMVAPVFPIGNPRANFESDFIFELTTALRVIL